PQTHSTVPILSSPSTASRWRRGRTSSGGRGAGAARRGGRRSSRRTPSGDGPGGRRGYRARMTSGPSVQARSARPRTVDGARRPKVLVRAYKLPCGCTADFFYFFSRQSKLGGSTSYPASSERGLHVEAGAAGQGLGTSRQLPA